MLDRFIERPVLSTVISIIIVILGIIGVTTLPVTQYPDIAPPTVSVTATYPGANAETVLESVIIPIEEQINGVEGMTYITSTASNSGRGQITVFFDQDYDPDIAAVNVQNLVALANPVLPSEVIQIGVETKKQQSSALMFMSVYSENPEYDDTYIANYLDINVVPEIKRVHGVGNVQVFTSKNYSMRVWIKPDKMASYGLEPSDVIAAINEQSQEAAAGALGENHGESFSYTIRYSGRYDDKEEYENIVIKAMGDGEFLRLKDVADIELGAENYGTASTTKGFPSVSMGIFQTKGSNAREIINEIYDHLEEMEKDFPEGLHYFVPFDTNKFLNASINKVVRTLVEAFILVFIVVFIFLQDIRSTLIPAIAVPVSIIGTFFFLNLFGFSINLLTLFALVLAIGIVVDDAIVVVEAVQAKLEQGEKNVMKGTKEAMHEIAGAIVAITLVMGAVFLPVTFIPGPPGVFYKQFGITLMIAIFISAVNALTLSPALCAVFLKPKKENNQKKKNVMERFHTGFNTAFNATVRNYGKSLHWIFKHKWVTPLVLVLAGIGIWWTSNQLPTGFIPEEDRGVLFANVELPVGATLDRTAEVERELTEKIIQIPGVRGVSFVAGFSLLSGQGGNFGLGFVQLDDWDERQDDDKSAEAILGKLFGVAATVPQANTLFFAPPSIPGYGATGGFEVNFLDRSGGSFDQLNAENQEFLMKLNQRPEIQYAQSGFSTEYPQYEMDINIPVAKEAGVDVNSIFRTLQGYIGGIYTADFSLFGKQFKVYVQAAPEDRVSTEDLDNMYVRTASGEMAPVSQFVDLNRTYGPSSVTRFNLFNSTKITGATNPGYTSGDAVNAIEEVITEFPANFTVDYSGLTREEVKAAGQTTIVFVLVIVFVYFFLAAQYESYLLPLSILFSVPVGIFGAYLSAMLMGVENSIYLQIALIMLIGLLAKNAILIVEFAIQRRRQGETIFDAAIDGAQARLRPILMTSFAFIFGLMPLVLATGVGAVGNRSIGTGSVGGLLIGTVLGVFVIPTLFIFFQWIEEKIVGAPFDEEQLEENANNSLEK
ncbi:MAG TPA: efflux RND transporter permease subunit [Flavobacteriaceae bacterium]|nr:efflux RND transporter permease subunit [Flavobacteriaceae bacterium]